jgi:periplasmic protein TonB
MSYVTQKTGPNPAGLSAAVLINGGVVAAALLFTTVVVPPTRRAPPVTTFDVPTQKPPPKDEVVIEPPKPNPVFVQKPLVNIPVPLDPVITTANETAEAPLFTKPFGTETKLASNIGMKQEIEKIIPPAPIFKSAERDPRFASNFQPDYPVGLLQREIEGKVTIKVLIGIDGRVWEAIIISTAHPDFGKAAQKQALREWRFKPATRDGKAVEDWQTLTVRFDINE